MAWMLLNGKRGMEKNEEKGRGWLQRAARQGHAEALKEMARRKW
jgi:TPR repeat protein